MKSFQITASKNSGVNIVKFVYCTFGNRPLVVASDARPDKNNDIKTHTHTHTKTKAKERCLEWSRFPI